MSKKQIMIEISDETQDALEMLAELGRGVPGPDGARTPAQRVLEYAAEAFAEGLRRPGSWEAAAVAALFGT